MKQPNIVVVGVAGCGKSSLGQALASALSSAYIEGDRFHPPENIARMQAGIARGSALLLPPPHTPGIGFQHAAA